MNNLNKHLAEKVMRWRKGRTNPHAYFEKWLGKGAESISIASNWKPTENIEQAMMCLDKGNWWFIEKIQKDSPLGTGFLVNVVIGKTTGDAISDTPAMAISLACGRATGWSDE